MVLHGESDGVSQMARSILSSILPKNGRKGFNTPPPIIPTHNHSLQNPASHQKDFLSNLRRKQTQNTLLERPRRASVSQSPSGRAEIHHANPVDIEEDRDLI